MKLLEAIVDRLEVLASSAPSLLVTTFEAGAALPAARKIRSACAAAGVENALGVADVLFPEAATTAVGTVEERLARGLKKVRKLRAISSKPLSGWSDTYFERLAGQHIEKNGQVTAIGTNRIAEIITKSNKWKSDFHAAFYASTTRANDKLRKRGAPCLQYVQFELFRKDQMRLFALYRSHDFLDKALGNFIGLNRLGEFVASATNRNLAEVTVISLNPFAANKTKAKALSNGLAQL